MLNPIDPNTNEGTTGLSPIKEIIEEAANGRMFILVDDEDRENEGDLIIPATAVEADHINFMAKYGRGLICLAMDGDSLNRLGLGLMPKSNVSRFDTAFTVSIEAREGVTTGISAADRAHTIQVACNPNSTDNDIVTPGHVFPLAARNGGVLVRAGHTEAAMDISRLAGKGTAGVICEIMNDQGEMMRLPELQKFAAHHNMKIATIADLIAYRRQHDHLVHCTNTTPMAIDQLGEFNLRTYHNAIDGREHLALTLGKIQSNHPVYVRMHAFDLIKDVLVNGGFSPSIHQALKKIADHGQGVLVLLQSHPETVTETAGDVSPDLRDYGVGAQILLDIGVRKMMILSDRPRHIIGLEGYGLEIEDWVPLGY